MFTEVKETLPISGDDYNGQIIREIKAAALDLTTSAEIELPGTIDITVSSQGVITDNSTITDDLIIATIATWVNMRIGNPPNYDKLLAAYNSLKGQLRLSKTYTASEVTTE